MKCRASKSGLAIELSRLEGFKSANEMHEQYPTEPEIAADMLWTLYMRGEIAGKTVADFGAGNGILGIGALILGAEKAVFVDKDAEAMRIARQNYDNIRTEAGNLLCIGEAEFIVSDIKDYDGKADIVLQNPPFGTRERHADRDFLAKAFKVACKVWSFHKTSTDKFVEAFAKDSGFEIKERLRYSFPLHASQKHHTRKIHRIDVTLYRIEKKLG